MPNATSAVRRGHWRAAYSFSQANNVSPSGPHVIKYPMSTFRLSLFTAALYAESRPSSTVRVLTAGLALAAALMVFSGCKSSNVPPEVTYVPSPNRHHVAVLMRNEAHGLGRLWAWYAKLPDSGTSLTVLDNDPPHTVRTPGQPIVYRRIVFLSTCNPEDFAVSWVDNDTLSVATRCPADRLHPAGTPANEIKVTYAPLQ